jgi:hypothetical protein
MYCCISKLSDKSRTRWATMRSFIEDVTYKRHLLVSKFAQLVIVKDEHASLGFLMLYIHMFILLYNSWAKLYLFSAPVGVIFLTQLFLHIVTTYYIILQKTFSHIASGYILSSLNPVKYFNTQW